MKLQSIAWVAFPVLIGATVYASRTGLLERQWATVSRSAPVADFPAIVDLGEHEVGDHATAKFTIANLGGGVLMIEEVRANCSCSALEREVDGQPVAVESLQLGAGEAVEVKVRVAVRSRPGAAMHNLVTFRTNDPTRPTGEIEIVVPNIKGGVTMYPSGLFFGTVPIGSPVRQVIDLHDMAVPARSVTRATSRDPERVAVRLLPPDPARKDPGSAFTGTLIGHLEVTVRTDTPGPVESAVEIDVPGAVRPDPILVSGRVAAAVEASPASLSLPRMSGSGPLYSANCLCRSAEGKPFDLRVDSAPEGLTAEILDSDSNAGVRVVRITWDPQHGERLADGSPHPVRLRAKTGGNDLTLEVPVTCRQESRR